MQIKNLLIIYTLSLILFPIRLSGEEAPAPEPVPSLMGPPSLAPAAGTTGPAAAIVRLWNDGKKSEAWKQVKKWMKKEKKSPEPWVAASRLEFMEGNFKRGLKMAKKALKRGPLNVDAYFWKGRAFEALNKNLEAANEFRAALVRDPNYIDAQVALNRVEISLGHSRVSSESADGGTADTPASGAGGR